MEKLSNVLISLLTFSSDFSLAFLQAALLSASKDLFSAGLKFSSRVSDIAAEIQFERYFIGD